MYRNKRYPFIDIRTNQSADLTAKCMLDQIYSENLMKKENEQREIKKKGGTSTTLIHWGKDVSLALEIEAKDSSHSRIRLTGWQPDFPTFTGSFALYEHCIMDGDGSSPVNAEYSVDKDNSITGRIIGNIPYGLVGEAESSQPLADVITCMATYPDTISNDYNAAYYSPQIVALDNGTLRVGWYDSGNMITPPGPIRGYSVIRKIGNQLKIETFGARATPGEDYSKNWIVQLAKSCGETGNNDAVNAWPRSRYWKPSSERAKIPS